MVLNSTCSPPPAAFCGCREINTGSLAGWHEFTGEGPFRLMVTGTSYKAHQNCFILRTQLLFRKNEQPVELFWFLTQEAPVTLPSAKDSNMVNRSGYSLMSYLLHKAQTTAQRHWCCREGAALPWYDTSALHFLRKPSFKHRRAWCLIL